MAAGAFFFSVMTLGVKLIGARLPSQEVVLVRGAVALCLSYLMLRRARIAARASRPLILVLRGLFGFGSLSCQYYSLVHLPLADATVLQYTNPLWTAVLAAWLLSERMEPWEVVLVALSLLGVVAIARPTFLVGHAAARPAPVAVAIALAGALCSACAYVTIRGFARDEPSLLVVFYFTLVTVPAALPATLLNHVAPTAREWLLLLGIGASAQAGQVYLTRGLQMEPAGRATAAGYLQIVFAALWGILFFREIPDVWLALGAVAILGSTLLLARAHTRSLPLAPLPDEASDLEAVEPPSR